MSVGWCQLNQQQAIALALALGELLSKKPSKQKPENGNEQEQPCANPHNVSAIQHSKGATIDSSFCHQSSPEDQWHNEQTRCWERQIYLGKWLNWITGIGVGVALGALFFVYLQAESAHIAADASKISADVASATLVATQRPWISIEAKIEGDWQYAHGANLYVGYVIENHGSTPAIGVYLSSTIVLWQVGGDETLVSTQRKLCDYGKQDPPINSKGGYTIFPHQQWTEHSGFGLDKRSVDEHMKHFRGPKDFPPVFFTPFIVGCVTYKFSFDKSVHQTPFILMVGTQGSQITTDMHSMRIDQGSIPARLLSVLPVSFKGGAVPD